MPFDRKSDKWIVLAITCIGALMGPLDSTIVSVSLPTISQSLHMDYATSVWVPTAYLVTLASLLLTAGRWSDMKGRKPLFILGFVVFVLGSLPCSIAQDGVQLIAFRIVQGVGAAFIMATSTAIITAAFPPQERGKALGINTMSVYIGLTLGPPLGAFLTGALGWQSIFWVNVPIGITVIALAAWKLAEPVRELRARRFDIAGAVTFGIALVSLLIALTIGEEVGWTALPVVALAILSLFSIALFLFIESRKGREAMLDLELVTKNRLFAFANISTLLNYTAYFGIAFVLSFFMQRVLGYSLYLTGLVLLSMPLVMSILSPISGWASDRLGSRVLASGGMALVGVGLLLLSTLDQNASTLTLLAFLIVVGVGMGLFSSPNTSAVMGCVRKEQLGVASGTLATMRTVGQSLSLAVMGAVMAVATSSAVVSQLFSGSADITSPLVADEFIVGMSLAFQVAAVIAFIGAATSLARGKAGPCEPRSSP
jgi:EmrB/QacA subfamily drug resistance transporter